MSSPYDLERLRRETFVDRVDYHPRLDSTNDELRRLAPSIALDETVLIIADEQTAGRGRGSNRWWTGPGALAFSLLFNAPAQGIERRRQGMIALAAALASVETAAHHTGSPLVGLHWPNDVYVARRKLAGILVETLADGRSIIGIGCNLNNSVAHAPEELSLIVTIFRDLTGREHDRTDVLVDLLRHGERRLRQLAAAPDELGQDADRHCLQQAETLTIEMNGVQTTGICAGIAPDGALLLDTAHGPQKFYSGVLIKQQPKW